VISLKTKRELEILREANAIVAEVLAHLAGMAAPGVTTAELDAVAEDLILKAGGKPSFKGYHGYPSATCISVDEVIVHGIPGSRKLCDNQIVSIDVGVNLRGYHGDAAISIACGALDEQRQLLLKVTDLALSRAIGAARAGNYLEAVGKAVQSTCESYGLSVVRSFVGHGIGAQMHEEPQIPNFVTGDRGAKLKAGMVLAIEPMVNLGTHEVKVLKDGWTAVTADGLPSAHFEHSIVVRDGEAEILSTTPRLTWGRRQTL
jgi:methionyl aminopeptidase